MDTTSVLWDACPECEYAQYRIGVYRALFPPGGYQQFVCTNDKITCKGAKRVIAETQEVVSLTSIAGGEK